MYLIDSISIFSIYNSLKGIFKKLYILKIRNNNRVLNKIFLENNNKANDENKNRNIINSLNLVEGFKSILK